MEQDRTENEEMVLPEKQDAQRECQGVRCSLARKLYSSRAKQWVSEASKVKSGRARVSSAITFSA